MTEQKKLSLFSLTWPIFIELTLYMLMGNADTLMLSQYSDEAVAAVGVANQILYMVIVMFGFIATGTSILIAQYAGAKKEKTAAEIAAVSIWANLLFGIVLSALLLAFSKPILQMMNLPHELFPEAHSYLIIVGGFSFIQALIMTIGAILKSYGFTRDTMHVTIGMNVLNVIGNYLFIFGPLGIPVLGVEGVALSTTVSRAIGLIVSFMILWKRMSTPLPLFRFASLSMGHIKNLLKIGIPSAGEHIAYNTSQMVITYFITILGTEALTTKVYAQNIMMFIFLFSVAISQGTQIIIGHFVGAQKYEEAYRRCLKSLRLAIVISMIIASIFSFFSDSLFAIFTNNERIIEVGGTLILLTIILEPGRSFNLVIINSLRAAGDVKFPVYIGIASMWGVSVPIAYILGIHFGLGLAGIWIAFIADEWLRGLLVLWRWRSNVWRGKSFVNKEAAVM
ncbi:putative MATE family efflux protein [Thermolongibacillus altinsuensis]|uniref:Putative MATE family efflux protein n=1 Tax=Thermolongibacillus altinsuensis TaxID=575256 RepID=A0A4R1QF72_9BACL|nr:MATE family efflux transporter [Thermolongibacillus altinsuensis]TCL51063.1 putative MATE family efflux protein [Thermolongibacillus altinsuensis]